MKVLRNVLMTICLGAIAIADTASIVDIAKSKEVQCQKLIKDGASEKEIAQRGCCSWHSGVCGCSDSGSVSCCDGTLSPSCTCKGGEPLNLKPNM